MINIESRISKSKDIDVSDLDGEIVMMNIEKEEMYYMKN